MKYQNIIFNEFVNMLNNNTSNVEIAFKTYNNLITYINNRT